MKPMEVKALLEVLSEYNVTSFTLHPDGELSIEMIPLTEIVEAPEEDLEENLDYSEVNFEGIQFINADD